MRFAMTRLYPEEFRDIVTSFKGNRGRPLYYTIIKEGIVYTPRPSDDWVVQKYPYGGGVYAIERYRSER
jgi:hypothetical protein